MQHLEGSRTPVLYIGRTVLKVNSKSAKHHTTSLKSSYLHFTPHSPGRTLQQLPSSDWSNKERVLFSSTDQFKILKNKLKISVAAKRLQQYRNSLIYSPK